LESTPGTPFVTSLLDWRRRRLKALADLWWNGTCKRFASPEAICDIHALLPSFQLATIKLLEATVLLEVLVLVIMIVKIKITHLVETTRELAPSALPLRIASLAACSPETLASPDMMAADFAWVRTLNSLRSRRFRLSVSPPWPIFGELKQVSTFHAIPITVRDVIESDAMRVVGSIAAIAK
jgi:hypothetical protein